MARVAIIDYGVGNLRSVEKAFAAKGHEAVVTNNEADLRNAAKLVLPGVGAFAACMNAFKECGLIDVVLDRVAKGIPLLGVCVGMQMLFEESDEFGKSRGLGLLRGRVCRFSEELVVPQVGWNSIKQRKKHSLFNMIEDESFFYFVHSYFCEPADSSVVVGETEYGVSYASVVSNENIFGVQFHPEKSQTVGLQLLSNFARL